MHRSAQRYNIKIDNHYRRAKTRGEKHCTFLHMLDPRPYVNRTRIEPPPCTLPHLPPFILCDTPSYPTSPPIPIRTFFSRETNEHKKQLVRPKDDKAINAASGGEKAWHKKRDGQSNHPANQPNQFINQPTKSIQHHLSPKHPNPVNRPIGQPKLPSKSIDQRSANPSINQSTNQPPKCSIESIK